MYCTCISPGLPDELGIQSCFPMFVALIKEGGGGEVKDVVLNFTGCLLDCSGRPAYSRTGCPTYCYPLFSQPATERKEEVECGNREGNVEGYMSSRCTAR